MRALELMDLLRLPQDLLRQERDEMFRRRAPARGAWPAPLPMIPQILFFDEPLSAIDYKLRKTLEKELKDIHRETEARPSSTSPIRWKRPW